VAGFEADLRSGIDEARAAAIVRALTNPEVYAELVAGAGWMPDEYEKWLSELLAEVLVRSR